MNKTLIENVRTKLVASGGTTHVYYYHLPSDELLASNTITFELNNTSNLNFLDSKEQIKTYALKVNLNSPSLTFFVPNSIYIKNSIYDLTCINSNVRYISLIDEELIWDDELNIWTLFLNFEIQYNQ